MPHSPIDRDRVAIHLWPNDPADGNDPADDGSALVGVWHALLIEAGVVAVMALIVLLYRLF